MLLQVLEGADRCNGGDGKLGGMSDVHDHNRRAWDQRVRENRRFTRPVDPKELADAMGSIDPWVAAEGPSDKRVLCLAAGGGRQGILYANAGADVTVVDISQAMLDIDDRVVNDRRLRVRTVRASMDDLSMLADGVFDIVVHPVSTCYVPDIVRVYAEVARVTRAGGLYVSQHKQPTSLQAHTEPSARGYELLEPYYRGGPLPQVTGSVHREAGTLEYLHGWSELIGELCRSGFVIEDLSEPVHAKPEARPGTFGHRSCFVAPYVRLKARRRGEVDSCERPTLLV